jgi:hypothetical protein
MDWTEYPYIDFIYREDTKYKQAGFTIDIIKNGKTISNLAIVDSGAYISIFPDSFAESFGIDKSKCKKHEVGGITGPDVEGFESNVKIRIPKFDEEFEIPVVFVPDLNSDVLLGQKGFFDLFRVKFDKVQNTFSLISVESAKENMEGVGEFGAFAARRK